GLTLNDNIIGGVPTDAGLYEFAVAVTDAGGNTATKLLSSKIRRQPTAPPVIEFLTPTLMPSNAVHIGLWDGAFNANALLNGNTDATNFIGRDTNRFYIRVQYPAGNKNAAVREQITINWWTKHLHCPEDTAFPSLKLIETGPDTGTFMSEPLMIVT